MCSGLLFLSSGCVYLRLLKVKRQLADFDRYVSLSSSNGFSVRFSDPVLSDKDMRFLIGADPLKTVSLGEESFWHYAFAEVDRPDVPLSSLTLDLSFEDGKLAGITVPESFLELFPAQILEASMRAAAHADVNKLARIVSGEVALDAGLSGMMPDRAKIDALLGEPLERRRADSGLEERTYRYEIVDDPNGIPILARFHLDDAGLLHRLIVRWDTASVDVSFVRTPSGSTDLP